MAMVVKKMQTQGLGNEIFRKSFNRFVQVNERSRLYLPRRERIANNQAKSKFNRKALHGFGNTLCKRMKDRIY